MAFTTAAGYSNLPNGNFSPVIYSKQVQLAFRKSSVAEDITNNDYFGDIANFGDTVRIIKEPEITVKSYARGTQISPQDLDDEDFSLVVDQANYFAFKVIFLALLKAPLAPLLVPRILRFLAPRQFRLPVLTNCLVQCN